MPPKMPLAAGVALGVNWRRFSLAERRIRARRGTFRAPIRALACRSLTNAAYRGMLKNVKHEQPRRPWGAVSVCRVAPCAGSAPAPRTVTW